MVVKKILDILQYSLLLNILLQQVDFRIVNSLRSLTKGVAYSDMDAKAVCKFVGTFIEFSNSFIMKPLFFNSAGMFFLKKEILVVVPMCILFLKFLPYYSTDSWYTHKVFPRQPTSIT